MEKNNRSRVDRMLEHFNLRHIVWEAICPPGVCRTSVKQLLPLRVSLGFSSSLLWSSNHAICYMHLKQMLLHCWCFILSVKPREGRAIGDIQMIFQCCLRSNKTCRPMTCSSSLKRKLP